MFDQDKHIDSVTFVISCCFLLPLATTASGPAPGPLLMSQLMQVSHFSYVYIVYD